MSSDAEYFKKRTKIEDKHYLMVSQWISFFNPDTVLDCGCGAGQFVRAFADSDVEAFGFDKSNYIIEQDPHKLLNRLSVHDITVPEVAFCKNDLVIAFDILEHLNNELDVKIAINNMKDWSDKFILVSVPVLGDPNLEKDPTHRIFKNKSWWQKQFIEVGLKEIKVPEYFLFADQIMIFEVPK